MTRLLRYIIFVSVIGFVYGAVTGDCLRAWIAAQQWQQVVWMVT